MPSGVGIGDVNIEEEQRKMIRIIIDARVNVTPDSNATLAARIPRSPLDNITGVATDPLQGTNAEIWY